MYIIDVDKDFISEASTGEKYLRFPMHDGANQKYYIPTVIRVSKFTRGEQIENEVWDLVKTLIKMNRSSFYWIFGDDAIDCITEMTYQEAKAEYDKWQEKIEQMKEIKIGDELINFRGEKYIVYKIDDNRLYGVDFAHYPPKSECFGSYDLTTTGRSFPMLAEMLAKIKEET